MKRIILITFGVVVYVTSALAAEIGVVREFQGRRPAFNKFKVDANHYGWDLDNDGLYDDAVISVVIDSLDTILVYNPATRAVVWGFKIDSLRTETVDKDETITIAGFVPFDGTLHAVVSLGVVDAADYTLWRMVIINTETNEVAYNATGRPVAILELPNGKPVVLSYVEQDNIYRIIGVLIGLNQSVDTPLNLNPAHPALSTDYQLSLKFQAEAGLRLAYDPDLFDPPGDSDLDGDGHADIPMLVVDNGQLTGMVVRGGDNFDVLWQFTFPDAFKANILRGFHGFADTDGDGVKEAIVGDNLAITLDDSVHVIAENLQILDVNDIDNDGHEDIIGLDTADSTVVIYGILNSTSVANYDPAEIHFQLFQNYPNPFNPSTTITYSVAQAGAVELTIFNTLGQAVRTLVNQQQSAGNYVMNWDGRDETGRMLSSGTYFYRLEVGESLQTRRMLFLK